MCVTDGRDAIRTDVLSLATNVSRDDDEATLTFRVRETNVVGRNASK